MSSCLYKVASVADGFLCLFVFFPLAILHWRGTWGLQDVYFFPNNEELSGWTSLIAGTVGCISLQTCQPYLFSWITPKRTKLYFCVSRLYLYISGWFVMCYWRGMWNTMDFYLTEGWVNSVIIYAVTQLITFVTMTSRNNVGLPFSLALDTDEDLLKSDTVLKIKPSEPLKYFGDVCFSQLVIVTCNICVWRGIWNVFDAFLFPHDHLLSDLVSLGMGYVLCIQLFMLQWPSGITSARLDEYPTIYKVLFEDVLILVATWFNLLLWRGAWDLCVAYVIPDPTIGGWVSHWVGTIFLIIFQTFNSVAMNGMERDGDYKNGEGVFPTKYLRLFYTDSLKVKHIEEDSLMESAAACNGFHSDGSGLSEEEVNFEIPVYTVPKTKKDVKVTTKKANGVGYHSVPQSASEQETVS